MRLPDWEARLDVVIAAYQGGVFIWGERDCLRLPLECAEAVTGRRFVHLVPAYRSGAGAALALRRRGFSGVGDALGSHFEEIAPAFAGRGDIGIVIEDGTEAGAVVLGAHVSGIGRTGLSILPRSRVSRAFRVG